jgi:O-antigen/teichoic acid export membrane protein
MARMAEATEEPAEAEGDSLDRLVRRGLVWSFVNTASTRGINFLITVVLAHLVAPSDWGVFAVALVTMSLLLSLNDVGISSAIVRFPGDVRDIAATGATLIIGASFALYGVLFALSPVVARVLKVPEATGVLRLLAVSVILDALFAVQSAALTREFKQRQRTISDLANLAVFSTLAISLAVHGSGPWALAWATLAGTTAGGIVILATSPIRVWPGWDPVMARQLVHFGIPLTGSAFLTFAVLNTDYIVVGHVLGPVALGFYYLAFNISSWPVTTISFTVRRVSLAGFSRLQHDRTEMHDAFIRAARLLSTVAFPVCALLVALSAPLVRFVYGERWAASASPLRWLAVLGAMRVVAELGYDYLVAAGRPRATVVLQAAWFFSLVPALTIGAHLNGITGVGEGHAFVVIFVVLPVMLWALGRTGLSPLSVLRVLGGSLALAAGAGGVAYLGTRLASGEFARVAIGGTSGAFTGAAIVALVWQWKRRSAVECAQPVAR